MPGTNHRTKPLAVNHLGKVKPDGLDWKLIRSIFNITPIYKPITQIRLLVWSGYLVISIYLLILQIYLNSSKHIIKWLDNNVIPLSIAIYMLEPFVLFMQISISRYPQFLTLARVVYPTEQSTYDTVVLIPCHNAIKYSEDINNFTKVLQSACEHFKPENIFIIDNGSKNRVSVHTKKVAFDVSPQINYLRYRYSNRSVALWQGVKYIMRISEPHIKHVLIIDSNVIVPQNYKINRLLLTDEQVGGLIYPLYAASHAAQDNLLVKMQRLEYQLTTQKLATQDELNITPAEQSGCGLYRLNVALRILQEHSGEFNAEERLFAANLRNNFTMPEYKFHLDKGPQFRVNVPQTYFGIGNNLWRERVRNWDSIFFEQFWPQICKPFLSDWINSRILILKLYQAHLLFSELINVFRYAYFFIQIKNPSFWRLFALAAITESALLVIFNYKKLPTNLRNDFKTVALFPIYLIANNFLTHMAFWRVFLYTFTIKESTRPIKEKAKNSEFARFQNKQPRESKHIANSIYVRTNKKYKEKSTPKSSRESSYRL